MFQERKTNIRSDAVKIDHFNTLVFDSFNYSDRINGYHYTGMKTGGNAVFISKMYWSIAQRVSEALNNPQSHSGLCELFVKLGIPTKFKFEAKFTPTFLIEYKLSKGLDISRACKEMLESKIKFDEYDINVEGIANRGDDFLSVDILDENSWAHFIDDLACLESVINIKAGSIRNIRFSETNTFATLSSGQRNIFHSFIGIASKICSNAVILIDEPEISLHPSWQLKYIEILDSIVRNYSDVSVIIATHSPFVGISGQSSCTVHAYGLHRKGNHVQVERNSETTGWSFDSVLYRIFWNTKLKKFRL
ncbi:MAG: AAA family ATPase [Fibrobacterota bacterium]|nr:MAG: AAA family ATPase [Fibrobacterota bacterium]